MSRHSSFGTPLSSKERKHTNSNSFHGFIRPSGQFGLHLSNSFSGSPRGAPGSNDFSEFIPLEYSSPVKNRGRGSGGHWRGSNRSYSNSPGNSGYNSSCSPYHSNQSHTYSARKNRGNHGNVNRSYNSDISLYYDRSMLEDPWAELEQKLQRSGLDSSKRASKKGSEIIDVPVLSDSDGVDSQENESFVSSEGSS